MTPPIARQAPPPIAKKTPLGSLSVFQHGLDVACCLEALLSQPVLRSRMETALGKILDPVTQERFLVLALLHDVGKLSSGFQARIREIPDFPKTSHLIEVVDLAVHQNGLAHDLGLNEIEAWGPDVFHVLAAILAHHGRPITPDDVHPKAWAKTPWHDPGRSIKDFAAEARRLFPLAFSPVAPAMAFPPLAQHLFTGLLTLADQIGSRESAFPMGRGEDGHDRQATLRLADGTLRELGLDGQDLRKNLADLSDEALFGWPAEAHLNPMQSMLRDLSLDHRLILLESETGSGKTEAAFLRFRRLFEAGLVDSLYFAVPTRSAAVQLHRRINQASERLMGIEAVLAVPGVMRSGCAEGTALPGYQVRWDDDPAQSRAESRWSAETGRRYLAAPVAVGTIDQLLLSGLMTKWAHMRGASLSRSLLVVDEVHASDSYMQAILKSAIDAHRAIGGYTLLMSATFGSLARARLFDVAPKDRNVQAAYPAISWASGKSESFLFPGSAARSKSIAMSCQPILKDPDAIAREALSSVRQGGRVLIIRNTVRAAGEAFESILKLDPEAPLLTLNGVKTLHHARYAAEDRQRLDAAVERALHPKTGHDPVIVIGTQTVEQSLDIDADFLISDLCPIDVLLQRLGRLFRHDRSRPPGFASPRCLVLRPEVLAPGVSLTAYGIGPVKEKTGEGVYPNLLALVSVLRLLESFPQWNIPAMNRMLVETGTDAEDLARLASSLGPEWTGHLHDIHGSDGAKRQQAGYTKLDRRRHFSFEDGIFPEDGAPTRLGAGSVQLRLAEPIEGPFCEKVSEFAVPFQFSEGVDPTGHAVARKVGMDLELSCGTARFLYTCQGLSRTND